MDEWNGNTPEPQAPAGEAPYAPAPESRPAVPPFAAGETYRAPAGPPPVILSVSDRDMTAGSRWGKFYGVMLIIGGAFACFGIITIPIGIFHILGGSKLIAASDRLADTVRDKTPRNISGLINELCAFNRNMGIAMIITIAFVLLYILGILAFAVLWSARIPSPDVFPSGPHNL